MTSVRDVSNLTDVALLEDIENILLPGGVGLFFAHGVDFDWLRVFDSLEIYISIIFFY